ncbi:MAG: energy transducer TonB [Nitrospirota bacterium]
MKVRFSWLFYWRVRGIPLKWRCIGGGGMGKIKNNYGMLISIVIHVLIMTIPVSMAVVQRVAEVELFVMNDDRPVIQGAKVVKKQKTLETPKVREEIKEPEKPQIIEEKPKVLENKIVEPTVISNKAESISLPSSYIPNPPFTEVREASPAPQIQDVEFGSIEGPRFLRRELPNYPMIARRMGKEGRVILRLTMDEKGKLLNIEVVENAGYGFTEAAVEAVKRSTFQPAIKDRKPIASRALLPIRFTLLENDSSSERR